MWLATTHLQLVENNKLKPKFIVTFNIMACASETVYTLEITKILKALHPIFHISCWKKLVKRGNRIVLNITPELEALPDDNTYKVKKIVAE